MGNGCSCSNFYKFYSDEEHKKEFRTDSECMIKSWFNINIALNKNEEEIKKIIKIQSHIRGMEMRNKIKLKSRNKKLINQNIQNKINYESIIVNKIKIFFY